MRGIGLLLFLCGVALYPNFGMAQAQQNDPKKFLSGVTKVDLRVWFTARPESRCGLSEGSLRAPVIQIFAPAGLQIDSAAGWTIDFEVLTIKAAGTCMSAIAARSQVYGLIRSFAGEQMQEIYSLGIVQSDLRVNSSAESEHPPRIVDVIKSISQEFLSTWLEVNSGTPLVSRIPRQPSGGSALEDVVSAQRALQRLGLYTGQIDGALGPGTRNGIIQFQRQNGISPTGELNEATLLLLQSRQ